MSYTTRNCFRQSSIATDHYGCSALRAYLTADALNNFTEPEKTLMQNVTVYTNDTKNGKTYSTEDKFYAAYGNNKDKYITWLFHYMSAKFQIMLLKKI